IADAHRLRHTDHLPRSAVLVRRRQAVALVRDRCAFGDAESAAQRVLDPFGGLGEGGFAVERTENGAADESSAAQPCQDGAAEPLHRDPAAVDRHRLAAVYRQRRLVTEIDRLGVALSRYAV